MKNTNYLDKLKLIKELERENRQAEAELKNPKFELAKELNKTEELGIRGFNFEADNFGKLSCYYRDTSNVVKSIYFDAFKYNFISLS